MPKQIQVDNQIIEFPDDMPDNEIEAVIKKQFYSQQQPEPQQQPQQEAPQQPKMSRLQALSTTSSNIPFAPRIKAGISALTAKTMGGDESIGAFYDEALGNELRKLKQAREQYPVQSFASQLATDITGGGVILKGLGLGGAVTKQALPKTTGLFTRIIKNNKQALAGGAVLGGLSAAGETEADLASIQGIADVATGSLYGAGGGVVGQHVGSAIGKSVPVVKQTIQRFRNNTPETVLSKVVTPEEAGQQARKLTSSIEQGRITALPEQKNENILGLTRILAKTPGSNKIITNYINNKTASSARRVGDIINKNISAESFFDTLDNTIAKRKEIVTPLYKQAEIEGQKYLDKILKTKKVNVSKPILGTDGNQLRDPATGIPLTKIVKENAPPKILYDNPNITKYVNMAKNEPLFVDPRLSNNSFVVLKGAKEMMDRDINIAIKNGDFTTSKALYGVKRQVLDILEKASPSYKEANKIYAGETALKNAQEEGLKFNQYRNGEEVKRAFSKLSDGEKETFRIGVKDYLMDKVAKSSDKNPSKAIFGNQLERRKIQALFDSPKQFTDFTKRLDDEMRVFDTKQRIIGGSRTDFNLAESDQLLDKVAKGAANIKKIGVADLILASASAIQRKYYGLNEQTAKELAEIMIDPKKSVQTLNNIAKKAQTAQEKDLIQKFTENLSKKNFARAVAPSMGRAMATEQLNNEGE